MTLTPGMPEGIEERDLRATVADVLDRWLCAGLAAGAIRDGSVEWFMGHGVATVEGKEPITENTVFRIASLTKTFTAIAVMQLLADFEVVAQVGVMPSDRMTRSVGGAHVADPQ